MSYRAVGCSGTDWRPRPSELSGPLDRRELSVLLTDWELYGGKVRWLSPGEVWVHVPSALHQDYAPQGFPHLLPAHLPAFGQILDLDPFLAFLHVYLSFLPAWGFLGGQIAILIITSHFNHIERDLSSTLFSFWNSDIRIKNSYGATNRFAAGMWMNQGGEGPGIWGQIFILDLEITEFRLSPEWQGSLFSDFLRVHQRCEPKWCWFSSNRVVFIFKQWEEWYTKAVSFWL